VLAQIGLSILADDVLVDIVALLLLKVLGVLVGGSHKAYRISSLFRKDAVYFHMDIGKTTKPL